MSETELGERRRLAEQIIAASGAMRDPDRHLLWLVTLTPEALAERLAQIQAEQRWPGGRPGWLERAARKTGGAI
jgi:hypothetical protein